MQANRFRMDHGAGYTSILYRQQKIVFGHPRWVWTDALSGTKPTLQFEDEGGHPVDVFSLPLDGEFIDASAKTC